MMVCRGSTEPRSATRLRSSEMCFLPYASSMWPQPGENCTLVRQCAARMLQRKRGRVGGEAAGHQDG